MPIVSAIIPNYNHGSFLRQRIESVLNQTYQDVKITILDDCSTDNSREIIEAYRNHPGVNQIVYNNQNSGSTFKQWEKGIEFAQGQYVWIAESDDSSDNHFLENVMKEFQSNDSVGLVYTQSIGINEKNELLQSYSKHTEEYGTSLWNKNFRMAGEDFITKYMLYKNVIPNANAVVFRKDKYEDAGGINSHFTLNGDWDLYVRILMKSDIYFINEPLNYFRQHNNKGSAANIKNGNNIKEYYWMAKQWSNSLQLTYLEKKRLNKHIYKIWYHQSGNSRKALVSNNFLSILKAAFQADKSIPLRILIGDSLSSS